MVETWCSNCKKYAQVFNELQASWPTDHPDIAFAYVDLVRNDEIH